MSFRGATGDVKDFIFFVPGLRIVLRCVFPSLGSDWTALEGTDVRFCRVCRCRPDGRFDVFCRVVGSFFADVIFVARSV